MLVFIDFEASSLAKESYPIEVAWVFEDGRAEAHLIRPAPSWTDWGEEAEGLHKIALATLLSDGAAHDLVARRMVSELEHHDLLASSVPWDGKWLSVLLRGAGLHRRSLRLRDSDDAIRDAAATILEETMSPARALETAATLLAEGKMRYTAPPVHRALPDAMAERELWLAVQAAAYEVTRKPRP